MRSPVVPAAARRIGVGIAVLGLLVLLLLSHSFGRAVPTNNYRPTSTVDPLERGCYPLPGGARLDGLAYQVRWDGDVRTAAGERRRLRGQYDLVDLDEAVRLLVAAFTAVGFQVTGEESGAVPSDRRFRELRHPVTGEVLTIDALELPGTGEQTLVRGEFVLDLPVARLASDDPACREPRSTKRWLAGS
ncbi:hypothetical protein [Nocardioides sp. SYSU DS0651]|uniref:hypothetical protein n=1 Tax=Nocardioides sp. SYSU DS0651 TaxID=3415955 RepID=UPI003F4B1584